MVDAHAYAGFTYDYLALRQDWNGMDGGNGRIISMVNIGLDFANAFFSPSAVRAAGNRGNRLRPRARRHAHRVRGQRTGSTSAGAGVDHRCRVPAVRPHSNNQHAGRGRRAAAYESPCNQEGRLMLFAAYGGALHEAYSDIIGTAVEFMLHEPVLGSLGADYLLGEDTGEWTRRIDDPGSVPLNSRFPVDIRYPDAFAEMIWFLAETFEFRGRDFVLFSRIGTVDGDRTLTWLPSWDYGGVHLIQSHAIPTSCCSSMTCGFFVRVSRLYFHLLNSGCRGNVQRCRRTRLVGSTLAGSRHARELPSATHLVGTKPSRGTRLMVGFGVERRVRLRPESRRHDLQGCGARWKPVASPVLANRQPRAG